jgi:hypothetical protein
MEGNAVADRIGVNGVAELALVSPRKVKLGDSVPIKDRLLWDLDAIAALLGVSRRFLERERAAGRMPKPDVRLGRRLLWKPSTIKAAFGLE